MQPRNPRARIQLPSITDFARGGGSPDFNDRAHSSDREGLHTHRLLYTSASTLTVGDGSPFYPQFGGRIVGFRANVSAAPSGSAFQCDVEMDGTSVLNGDYIEVPVGSTYGYRKSPNDKIYLYPDRKYVVSIVTVSGATGPLVLAIEYVP